ncbi:5-methylcytosine restriction system specificity protein McrC [Rossellomorea sp. NPDC071047]|uniref:5-methylcytosine restriction system specificity protein McrC n=1 Tax=Rossellomorea sp. NPDC071047 TaxID=3390675 RepID=UPI003D05CC65
MVKLISALNNRRISDITCLQEKLYIPPKGDLTNLGIQIINNKDIYASNYSGICRLKDINGNNIKNEEDETDVILKIEPRFSLSVIDMLNYIRSDDEFERYLAPQNIKQNQEEKEINSLEMNELFHFYQNEPPIKVESGIAENSSVITITLFLTMLKEICKKPLMGRMIKTQENLVGKVKGKILFKNHIRNNLSRGRNERVFSEYLNYSEDIIENQILKAALVKSKRFLIEYFKRYDSVKSNYKETISYCSKVLDPISTKKISSKDLKSLKFSGFYKHYKPVINLAKMILDEISIHTNGRVTTTNYIIPYAISMEKLFEFYIRAYLKNNGIASYILKDHNRIFLHKYDDKKSIFTNTKTGMANYIGGSVKPDIILENPNTKEVIIFDVKYKDYKNRRFAREDRLQLLTYALMYNCPHVGLIFPLVKEGEDVKFIPQEIQSKQDRTIHYHQCLLDIERAIKDDDIEIVDYIQQLFRNK